MWNEWPFPPKANPESTEKRKGPMTNFEPRDYRFEIPRRIPYDMVERMIYTARYCVEWIYGKEKKIPGVSHLKDHDFHIVVIQAVTESTNAMARVFEGLLDDRCEGFGYKTDIRAHRPDIKEPW